MASKSKRKKTAAEAAPAAKAKPAPKPQSEPQSTPQPARATYVAIPRLMSRRDWQLVGVALGVALLAYLNALDNQFTYDDRYQILRNPTIADVSNIPKMFVQSVWQFMNRSAEEPVGAYYRPIFNIALILNYHLFGFDPFGWHVVSVLLHLGVTAGVYVVARQWSLGSEAAAAAALLFAVHPTHVESVAWASGIPDPLAGVFLIGALLAYERYRQEGWRRGLLAASVGLTLLAMLTKETAIAFPVFIGVRELLDRVDGEQLAGRITRAVVRSAPYGVAAVAYLGARYAVLGFLSKTEPKAVGITATEVVLTIPSVLVHYAKLLFVPYPLAITYDLTYVPSAADARFWVALVALAATCGVAIWLVRGSVVAQRALCWTVLFLLPVLNLKAFSQEESLVHDRYLYLPSIGFCLLVGMGIEWIASQFGERREAAFTWTTTGLTAVFLVLTVMQNTTWANDIAMATHAVDQDPNRPFLYNYVGAMHAEGKRPAEAEAWYKRAIEIRPTYYDALTNLGDVYRAQNRMGEAEEYYKKAIEAGSPYHNTYLNLAVVYMPAGRYAEARAALERAIEIQATPEAVYSLGWVYDQEGNAPLAEQQYVRALQLKPAYPEPRINLGVLQTKLGRFKEAEGNLEYAKTIVPQHPVLLFALGDLYMRTSRPKEAIAPLTTLTQREPSHRLAHTMLGLAYEATGDTARARASFQRAVQVAPQEQYTNVARQHLAQLGG